MQKTQGWVVTLDVYGFSNEVELLGPSEMFEKLLACYRHIEEDVLTDLATKRRKDYVRMYCFSDSLFLYYMTNANKSKAILIDEVIIDVREVMGIFMEHNLALRGGIAYGPVYCNDTLIVGTPIIRSHQYESSVPAPMVMLPLSEVHDMAFWNQSLNITDIVILKNGSPIAGLLIHAFPTETFIAFVKKQCNKYLTLSPHKPAPAKAWLEAKQYINNLIKDAE